MAGDIESSSIFGVRIADSFGTVVSPQSHVVIGVAVALMCLMLLEQQQEWQREQQREQQQERLKYHMMEEHKMLLQLQRYKLR